MAVNSLDSLAVRVTLEGDNEIRIKLQQLGQAGEEGGLRIARGGKAAEDALGTFGTAADKVKGQVLGLAEEAFPRLTAAFSLAGIAAAAVELVRGTASSITALKNLSLTTGFAEDTLVGLQTVFRETGVSAEGLLPALTRFSQNTGDARAKALNLSAALTGGVTVLDGFKKATDAAGTSLTTLLRGGARGGLGGGLASDVSNVTVLRGGVHQLVLDLTNAAARFKAVTNVSRLSFPGTEKGQLDALTAFIAGLIKLKKVDNDLATAIGVAEFGKQFKTTFAGLEAAFKENRLPQAIADALAKGLILTAENKKKVEEFNKAWTDVTDSLEGAARTLGVRIIPTFTGFLKAENEGFTDLKGTVGAFSELLGSLAGAINRGDSAGLRRGLQAAVGPLDVTSLSEKLVQDLTTAGASAAEALKQAYNQQFANGDPLGDALKKGFGDLPQLVTDGFALLKSPADALAQELADLWGPFTRAADRAVTFVVDKLDSLARAASSLFSSSSSSQVVASAPIPLPDIPDFSGNFAAGGGIRVRGPGSGTSDSILARVSNGEYINTDQAVDYWGVGVFEALNRFQVPRFAMGGFAAGGLAPAGVGGRPVTLVLGNSRFALSGAADVVGQLEKAARQSQMLSAGRRPSTQS